MTKKERSHIEDLRGVSRLAVEATLSVTAVVEEMHRVIGGGPAVLGKPLEVPTRVATGLVYGSIKGVTSLVGGGIDRALGQLSPLLGESVPGLEHDAVLGAINGVLGDYLDETDNPLAIEMSLRHEPRSSQDDGAAPAEVGRRLLLLVHGSCMNDRQWLRSGHDHGASLARELGYEPVYLHYNSGRHVSTNGDELAGLLDRFVRSWPTEIDEIVVVAHSMGGLVMRSACHAAERAGLRWRDQLRAIVFLGTPHHGAPLERGGNQLHGLLGISRYSEPLARLARLRGAGVTDLRFGNVLEEHHSGRDRFEGGGDRRSPLPLPEGVDCYAIAGTTGSGLVQHVMGDGLVPVDSAFGRHSRPELTLAFPEARRWTAEGVAHLDLLSDKGVYERLRSWLRSPSAGSAV